jgi:S-DNA-T family DNA segregation ATPase FtsK/SpoIIIE
LVDFVGVDDPQFAGELMQLKTKDELEAAATGGGGNFQSRDDLYDAAVDIVVRERRGSCSLLQRALGIGYGRAARLIDFMAEDGVVGQYNGSQARDVLISLEDWESRHNQSGDAAAISTAVGATAGGSSAKPRPIVPPTELLNANANPRRKNKIIPEPDEPSELDHEEEEVDEADADDEEDYDQGEWEDEEESDDVEEEASDDEWEEEDEADDADEDTDDESDDVDEDEKEEVIETSPPRAKRR